MTGKAQCSGDYGRQNPVGPSNTACHRSDGSLFRWTAVRVRRLVRDQPVFHTVPWLAPCANHATVTAGSPYNQAEDIQ